MQYKRYWNAIKTRMEETCKFFLQPGNEKILSTYLTIKKVNKNGGTAKATQVHVPVRSIPNTEQ